MTDADDWEAVARETAACALASLPDDATAATDSPASTLLFGGDVAAAEVGQMRAFCFTAVYVTEAVLARLCEQTAPWDAERAPFVRDPGAARPHPLPAVRGQPGDGGDE